jgi:hypothetical protein
MVAAAVGNDVQTGVALSLSADDTFSSFFCSMISMGGFGRIYR